MLHILSYSGGKDSTATALHLKDKGIEFIPVFCDTGWEHPYTYRYIDEIDETVFGGKLIRLANEKFPNGMRDLVQIKKRVPSAKARFCTEHLKIIPMIEYLKTLEDEYVVYQGIRSEESFKRSQMPEREWSDPYDCYVERPIFHWTVEDVFDIHKRHGVKINPLYLLGAGRVGCFPCVLVNHGDLKRLTRTFPDVWDRAKELEDICGRSFFPPNMIPARFHSGYDPKSGKTYPTVEDVKKYIHEKHDIDEDEPAPRCMSIYNLCE